MASGRTPDRKRRGLQALRRMKDVLVAASDQASRDVRSCSTCDARCCKVGFNSMKVTRIESLALARRLQAPDMESLVPEVLDRARRQVRMRGLRQDPDARFDCPLLGAGGRCLVHGSAQPVGCLTFRPVADGGCDHDRALFAHHRSALERAELTAFGTPGDLLPIPLALLEVLPPKAGRGGRSRRRAGAGAGRHESSASPSAEAGGAGGYRRRVGGGRREG